MHVWKSLILFAALVCSSVSFAFKPEVGEVPANLTEHLEYVDNTRLDLSALKGKPTVLYFGADWCLPCQETRPFVVAAAKKYGADANFVFVSMDDNTKRDAKKAEALASAPMKIAMPRMALCPPGKCMSGLRDLGEFGRIYGYPTAIVLDREGKVVWKVNRGAPIRHSLGDVLTPLL
jgi:thiol-disulfide isomerase/thioredoxin